MKFITSLILAASVASAAPARRQATNDVRMLINIDENTESRQNNIPLGQLVRAADAGIPDDVFALRLREDIGASCTFNYIFEGRENRQAQLSFGNDFQTAAPSGQVEWVDLLCEVGGAAGEPVQDDQAAEFRVQIERDSQENALQREFPAGQTISAGTAPFNRNTNVFALRLLEGEGLSCTFKYRFEDREDRTATFDLNEDFVTAAPSGFVEFQSLICQ